MQALVFPEPSGAELDQALELAAVCAACPFMDFWEPDRQVIHTVFGADIGTKLLQGPGGRYFADQEQKETNPVAAKVVFATLVQHLGAFTRCSDPRLLTEFKEQETAQLWAHSMRDQTFPLLQRLVIRVCGPTTRLNLTVVKATAVAPAEAGALYTVEVSAGSGLQAMATGPASFVGDDVRWDASVVLQTPTMEEQITAEVYSTVNQRKRLVGRGLIELTMFAGGKWEDRVTLLDDTGTKTMTLCVEAELVISDELTSGGKLPTQPVPAEKAARLFDTLLCLMVRRNLAAVNSPFLDTMRIAMLQQFCLIHGLGLPLLYITYLHHLGEAAASGVPADLASIARLVNAVDTVLMHASTPPLTRSELELEAAAAENLCNQARKLVLSGTSSALLQPATVVLSWGWAVRSRQQGPRAPPAQEESFEAAMQRCKTAFMRVSEPSQTPQAELEQAARALAWRAPLCDAQWHVCVSIAALLEKLTSSPSVVLRSRAPLLVYTLSVTLDTDFVRDVALAFLLRLAADDDTDVRCALSCSVGCVLYSAIIASLDDLFLDSFSAVFSRLARDPETIVRQGTCESLAPLCTLPPRRDALSIKVSAFAQEMFCLLANDQVEIVRRTAMQQAAACCFHNPTVPPLPQTLLALTRLITESAQALAAGPSEVWAGTENDARAVADGLCVLLDMLGPARWCELEAILEACGTSRFSEIRCALADTLSRFPISDLERQALAQGDVGCPKAQQFVRAADRLMRDPASDVRTAGLLAAPRLLPLAPPKVRDSWLGAITEVYVAVNEAFVLEFAPVAQSVARCLPIVLHYGGVRVWTAALRTAHGTLRSTGDTSTRRAIAASCHEVARMLGPQLAEQDVLQAVQSLLLDPDWDVRAAVLKNLLALMDAMPPHCQGVLISVWCSSSTPPIWKSLQLRELRAQLAPAIFQVSPPQEHAALGQFFVERILSDTDNCVRTVGVAVVTEIFASLKPAQARRTFLTQLLTLVAPSHFPGGIARIQCTCVEVARALLTGPSALSVVGDDIALRQQVVDTLRPLAHSCTNGAVRARVTSLLEDVQVQQLCLGGSSPSAFGRLSVSDNSTAAAAAAPLSPMGE